jgi:hypothetical protein
MLQIRPSIVTLRQDARNQSIAETLFKVSLLVLAAIFVTGFMHQLCYG